MTVLTEINQDGDALSFQTPYGTMQTTQDASSAGFFGSLAESIFEPGVNKSLFQAMNFSFLALVVTLLTMAYLTSFNKHVVFLMVVSTGLWVTMIWFVTEISKVQTQPQNAPQAAPPYEGPVPATSIPPTTASATATAEVQKPDLLPPSSSAKSTAREHVQTQPQKRTR